MTIKFDKDISTHSLYDPQLCFIKFKEDIFTHSLYDLQLCLNVIVSDGPNRNKTYNIRDDHFRFGSVFLKKNN
jgi:hypothetical protein